MGVLFLAHGGQMSRQIGLGIGLKIGLAGAALAACPGLALAQVTPPPPAPTPEQQAQATQTAQQLNPADQTAGRRASDDDVFDAPPPGPCPLASSTLSFQLKSVTFTGATTIKNVDLASTYAGKIGQTVSLADVCAIRDRASALLFRSGVLARVEIPEQTISGGALVLDVTTARVVSVFVKGDGGPAMGKVADYIEKLRGMDPFDLRQAQRYLLLASDVPGVTVSARLRPAPGSEPGAVDFYVDVTYDPMSATVSLQNMGSEALGPGAALIRGDFSGLTPYGDRTSLILFNSLDGKEQNVVQLQEEFRIGSEGLTVHGSVSLGKSRPGDTLKDLHLDGSSMVANVGISYPIIRGRRRNVVLSSGLELVNQSLKIGPTQTRLNDDKLRIAYATVEAAQSWPLFRSPHAPMISVGGDLSLRKGLSGLGASKAGDLNLSRFEGQPDALVTRFNGRINLRTVSGFTFDLKASVQETSKVLLSYEDFVAGNYTIGRGYDPASVQGDKGWGTAVELGYGPFPLLSKALNGRARAAVFGFYDTAHVDNLSAGGLHRTVHSEGVGVRVDLPHNIRLEATYAHPLDKPFPTAVAIPDDRWLINLTTRF